MNIHTSILTDQIAGRLDEHLQQVPQLGPKNIRRGTIIAGNQIDIDAVVDFGDRQFEILVEVKSNGSPSVLRQAAAKLKSVRKSVPGQENIYLAVGAPYISREGMDVCKEEGIGGLDAAGNCYLSFGGVYIDIRGNKNEQVPKKSVKSLFSPRSSRVIRVLLSAVERSWQVQEIAEEAGVSIGLVSMLKRKLLEEELVVEVGHKLRLKNPRKMIDAWAQNYRYKRNAPKEYYTLDDESMAERRIAEYCTQRNIRYALGLFSAASRVAPHVRMNKAFIFVETNPYDVARTLGFKQVSSGSNIMLLQPYDGGVFYRSRDVEGLKIVSDLQIYLDLKSYKGRGDEAAEFLMQQSLEPTWQRDQNTANVR